MSETQELSHSTTDQPTRRTYMVLVERTGSGVGFPDDHLGFTLTSGLISMEVAVRRGVEWQEKNGDNPCWNAFYMDKDPTDKAFQIINPNPETLTGEEGFYVRWIDRVEDLSLPPAERNHVTGVTVFGPFEDLEHASDFARTRVLVTDNEEWQAIGPIKSHAQFIQN